MRIDPSLVGQEWRATHEVGRHPGWRVARGVVLGVLAVVLAAAGHAAGGGRVAATQLFPLTLVACAVAMTLSGRTWRLPALVSALAGEQAVCHFLLMRWGAVVGGLADTDTHRMPMAMPGMTGMSGPSPAGEHLIDPRSMLLAHVLATLFAAVVLYRGEVTLIAVSRLLRAHLAKPRPCPVLVGHFPQPVLPWGQGQVPTAGVFVGLVLSRGPPA